MNGPDKMNQELLDNPVAAGEPVDEDEAMRLQRDQFRRMNRMRKWPVNRGCFCGSKFKYKKCCQTKTDALIAKLRRACNEGRILPELR